MHISRVNVSITGSTATSVAYSSIVTGRLLSVRYSSGGTISSTAVLTIANETTDETAFTKAIGSASTTYRPRLPICTSAGVTIQNTTGTANPVSEPCEFANERIRCSVGKSTASGQTGTLIFAIG